MLISCLLSHSFGARFRKGAGPGCTKRFMETMDFFFRAIAQQAKDRTHGDVPSFEEYVTLRWDTSGCKPCFALIEYAAGIDLPDEVMCHPVIRALEEAANSSISWSNVSARFLAAFKPIQRLIVLMLHIGHLLVQRRASARRIA